MRFKFDYKLLEQRGYEVSDDGQAIRVFAGEHAEPVLQRSTLDKVYSDIQMRTELDCSQAETIVSAFITKLHNTHIWTIAVTDEDI